MSTSRKRGFFVGRERLLNKQRLIIEITTGLLFLFTGNNIQKDDVEIVENIPEVTTTIVDGKALDPRNLSISTEEQVREYFRDEPILTEIAWCESKFEHYTDDGTVLRGEITPKDIGVMQINEYYHGKTADILGYNIHTLEGNMKYARWLYEREGTKPWRSSEKCWNPRAKELAFGK